MPLLLHNCEVFSGGISVAFFRYISLEMESDTWFVFDRTSIQHQTGQFLFIFFCFDFDLDFDLDFDFDFNHEEVMLKGATYKIRRSIYIISVLSSRIFLNRGEFLLIFWDFWEREGGSRDVM